MSVTNPAAVTEDVGLAFFVTLGALNFYSTFLPSVQVIMEDGYKPGFREGELIATGLTAGLGLILGVVTKRSFPFVLSLAIAGSMVVFYEWSVRRPAKQFPHNV